MIGVPWLNLCTNIQDAVKSDLGKSDLRARCKFSSTNFKFKKKNYYREQM
jgi:hypothetical protein